MTQFACIATAIGREAKLHTLACQHDFSVRREPVVDISLAEPGLSQFLAQEAAVLVPYFLEKGEDGAWFVQQQLSLLRVENVDPPFFGFLRAFAQEIRSDIGPYYFIVADEWDLDGEAVFFSGTVEQLISYLTLVKTFDLPLWQPENGSVQETPLYPFIFELLP